jgi:glutathione S-transferase
MLKLYYAPTSPYVRKVMMLAHEAGIVDRIEQVSATGGTPLEPNPLTVSANPLGKIPCLVRDDGPALFDSRVICQYIDSLHGGRHFYGEGAARWTSLTLEALADGIMDAAILGVYEWRQRPEEVRYQPWVDAQLGKVKRALDALEGEWLAHLKGPVGIGSIATACALGYLDLRYPDMGWRDSHPGLAAWHAEFAERESFKATVPPAV